MPAQGHSSSAWLVESAGERFVAKLIRDGRRYAEPGLQVAAAVERAGVPTGAPVPTPAGDLCADAQVDGRWCTLALLRFVAGKPLDVTRRDAAEIAGDLLGRVHAVLLRDSARGWVPNDLLRWCESHAKTNPDADTSEALKALTALFELDAGGALKKAVVYGDPSPEIIVGERPGESALIDWGTPSWGPLAHDVACWLRLVAPEPSADNSDGFLAAYQQHVRLRHGDLDAIPLFHELGTALRLGP